MSFASGKFVKPRGLALILRKSAPALLVETPKLDLTARIALIRGKFVKTRGFTVIFLHALADLVTKPEIDLRVRVTFVSRKLLKACRLALVS